MAALRVGAVVARQAGEGCGGGAKRGAKVRHDAVVRGAHGQRGAVRVVGDVPVLRPEREV